MSVHRREIVRYAAAATGARLFGLTRGTRALYRALGDRFSQEGHSEVNRIIMSQGAWLWKAAELADPPLDATARVLELGTGWTHFYGLFMRLLYPVKLVMFDVQDCRQLEALRTRFARVADSVDLLPEEYLDRRDQVRDAAREIAAATNFSDLYSRLGCEYVIADSGSLAQFEDGEFSMVLSVDVLEHVARDSVDATISGIARVLAPGGISAHQIGINDHLAAYAPGMPSKAYVGFSEGTWRVLFENRLQYVNRLQACEFAAMFSAAGFDLVGATYHRPPDALTDIRPAGRFTGFDAEELEIAFAQFLHQKPRADAQTRGYRLPTPR